MESHVVEKSVRFVEGVHAFVGVPVPDLHCFIVAAAHDESTVGRELRATDPVRMLIERALKLLPMNGPEFDRFVFRRTQQALPIAGEVHTANGCGVSFEHRRFSLHTWNPQANFFVL